MFSDLVLLSPQMREHGAIAATVIIKSFDEESSILHLEICIGTEYRLTRSQSMVLVNESKIACSPAAYAIGKIFLAFTRCDDIETEVDCGLYTEGDED